MFLVTTRLLAFIPDTTDRYRADGTAERLEAATGLGLTPFRRDPYFLACEGKIDPAAEDTDSLLVLDVFPAVIASGRPLAKLFAGGSWSSHHDAAAAEAQYYNIVEATAEEFRLESDVLGLKTLYRAEVPGGTLIASRIGDIGALFPDVAQEPDHLGLMQFLLIGNPCEDRTLHKNVRVAPTGGCYHWHAAKPITVTRARRQECPPGDAALGSDEAIARLTGDLTSALERRSRNAQRPFLLALSGGFDSRLTAALAKELGLPVELYTYGRGHHREVQVARAVAAQLGFPHHVLRYPIDNLTARLPMHLDVVEGQGDPYQVQIANLLDIPFKDGQGLLHGFFGDGVCGHPLEWLEPDELTSLDRVAEGIARYAANPAVRRFVSQLHLQASEDDFMHSLRESLGSDGRPYQAMIRWYWENRMRRMVGQQLPLLGTRLDVIAPFYDVNVMRTCASLPLIALERRNLVRFLFQRHFPALAKIPHDKETNPILPNLPNQISFAARKIPRKVVSLVLRQDRVLRIEERFCAWREQDIWRMSFGAATPAQRSRMVARLEALYPDLEKVFGIRPPEDLDGAIFRREPIKGDRWGHVHALRRLWSLGEYAHRLSGNARASERAAH